MKSKGQKLEATEIINTGNLALYKADDIDLNKLSDPNERFTAALLWAEQYRKDWRYSSQVKPYFNWAIEKDSGLLIRPNWVRFARDMQRRGKAIDGTIKNWCGRSRKLFWHLVRNPEFKDYFKAYVVAQMPDDTAESRMLASVKADTAWADYRMSILDAIEDEIGIKDVRSVREEDFNWLTPDQRVDLILSPDSGTLRGLRDTAMFAVALFTGIRRTELCHLLYRNLHRKVGGEWCLVLEALPGHVKSSGHLIKGREIPWGELEGCLDRFVYPWLEEARIHESGEDDNFVFVGIRGKTKVLPGPMSLPVLGTRLKQPQNQVTINGVTRYVTPHALRRTYAQSQKEAGVKIEDIARNMGHESTSTTFKSYLLSDLKSRRGLYAMPENFMKIMDKKAKEKQAATVPWVPKINKWGDMIMRHLESKVHEHGFWLTEITRGATAGQRSNISDAVKELKQKGKIKKMKLPKTATVLSRAIWIQHPKHDPPSRLRHVDITVYPPKTRLLVEVD